jgi:cation diffusion facilitator CzcD-associated flavoprotein CzcO
MERSGEAGHRTRGTGDIAIVGGGPAGLVTWTSASTARCRASMSIQGR